MTTPWTARLGSVVAASAFVLGPVGCAATSGEEPSAARTSASAGPRSEHLEALLMQDGEEPGFVRGAQPGAVPAALQVVTGVEALADSLGLTAADEQRLQEEGFLELVAAPVRAGSDIAGVTNVALYETAAGAMSSQAHDMQPAVVRAGGPLRGLTFFDVPGVPGARGWTAAQPQVGTVGWVDGRCYFANQGPGRLATLLAQGATAMHARTTGACR